VQSEELWSPQKTAPLSQIGSLPPCKATDHKKLQIGSVKQLPVFCSAAIQKGAEVFKQPATKLWGPAMSKLCDASSRRHRRNVGFTTPLP
jgi:hypothetical protein